jgi:hypothetical protein
MTICIYFTDKAKTTKTIKNVHSVIHEAGDYYITLLDGKPLKIEDSFIGAIQLKHLS